MPQEIGHFRLIRLLGKGGMGEVWEAVDIDHPRTVALKVLTSEALLVPDLCRRFEREMEIAAQIRNPYVLDVYEFNSGSPPYIAMPMIDGNNLAVEIKMGPLAVPRAVDIMAKVASALQAAHDKGLRHRDVKPSNIMLDKGHEEDFNHAFLIDWGIAHQIDTDDPHITRRDAMVGTPAYVAPERLTGTRADHRADIYSLAVTLYETLSGALPYGEPGQPFPIGAHLTGTPRPLPPHIPEPLRRVVLKGMARDPDARYQSASDFRIAAYQALKSRPSRFSPTPRQWRVGTGAGAGALTGGTLLATGALSTATWWAPVVLALAGAGVAWSTLGSGGAPRPVAPDDTTDV